MNNKIDNENKIYKKNNFSFFRILIVALLIIGGTYAVINGINVSNGSYATETTCFNIDYDVTNDDGTLPISGVLFPSSSYFGGLSGRVSMKINNLCSTDGIGKLNLNVISASNILTQVVASHCENKNTLETLTEYTTEDACVSESDNIWVTTGTALKYAVFDTTSELPVSVGYVDRVGSIEILNNIVLSKTASVFNIYIWLDGNISDNSYANLNFNANISGSAEQIEDDDDDDVLLFDDHTLMITSYTCGETTVGDNPYFTYTGQCEVIDDGEGDWRIRFLTDGTFISSLNIPIDAFLVGGGGGGGAYGGGGGGYTNTTFVNLKANIEYNLTIGDGGDANTNGEATLGFGAIAQGGEGAIDGDEHGRGGSGGSGGGGFERGAGGSDGGDGGTDEMTAGIGQGTTTREFGEESGDLYAGGGGSGSNDAEDGGTGGAGGGADGGGEDVSNLNALENTGGGGGGSNDELGNEGGSGGSGIIVIRNSRNDSGIEQLPSVDFDFTYTGNYTIINDSDGNWRIKFLTSGTFISSKDLYIDAFLVGGGGGGGAYGGGGGGYTNTTFVNLKANIEYNLTIGDGGDANTDGGNTLGFNAIAQGGEGAIDGDGHGRGGSGGSGGGGFESGDGGSDGADGVTDEMTAGIGQETTTREFGELTAILYAGGGGGGCDSGVGGSGGSGGGGNGGTISFGVSASVNTGGGGGGAGSNTYEGGSGGSGIIVIRNSRNDSGIEQLPSVDFDFTYTGNYTIINDSDGNWRIKFLTSGTFVSSKDISIDAFLVGGGGGGGAYGGGGGGKTLTSSVNLTSDTEYEIVVGNGGSGGNPGSSGGNTTGFSLTADGGEAGDEDGGSGGSGGGGFERGAGGTDGDDGDDGDDGETDEKYGGSGQGTTTREFEQTGAILYSGGGGGGCDSGVGGSGGSGGGGNGGTISFGVSASVNTGGGGGGAGSNTYEGGSGGSGILIIRNAR